MAYVDHTKGTGGAGTMMVRIYDGNSGSDSNVVEFWIRSADGATYINSPGRPFSTYHNGWWHTANFTYPSGSPWIRLQRILITSSQEVIFNIGATGTWGLGGPTEFRVWVARATVPPAPIPVASGNPDQITHTSIRYRFNSAGDGGSGILEWQVGYATANSRGDSSFTTVNGLNGTVTISNLKPGTTYYFWARGRNALGWGSWSSVKSARTLAGARVKVDGVWKEAIPYVKVSGVWQPAVPYVRVDGVWKTTQ